MQKSVYEYISKQTNDPIVERKTCRVSGTEFAVYQSDLEFYDKISPVFNGIKYQIPAPTLCPEEREARRMAWRNEWKLYRRKCDKTGKSMMAMYPENCGYTVYDRKVWYSDQRDAMDYARDYDFGKTFFENFEGLNRDVPKKSLHIVDSMENCEYCNYGIYSKSCYLVMGGGRAENCLYSTLPGRSVYDVDGIFNVSCQQTYQCIHCIGCFECTNSDHSNMCKFSAFLSFCNNCENCLGCVNLQTARYCILNKQYTKEEYEVLVSKIIEQMQKNGERGENFPIKFSTFGYNETVAQTFHPLTKQEALSRGYKRQDLEYSINIPEGLDTVQGKDLPKTIDEVSDDVLNKVILCEKTGKPYRIIRQELEFYRKHNIPLPTQHQDTRKEELFKKRMPKEFHIIPCSKCNQEMLSVYSANSRYKVYCESCYNKDVY